MGLVAEHRVDYHVLGKLSVTYKQHATAPKGRFSGGWEKINGFRRSVELFPEDLMQHLRPGNSLAPDVTIVEYRQKPFNVKFQDGYRDNVFAFVEIKFPKDWVKEAQMDDYEWLLAGAKNMESGRLALLRVPEDCLPRPETPPQEGKKPPQPTQTRKK